MNVLVSVAITWLLECLVDMVTAVTIKAVIAYDLYLNLLSYTYPYMNVQCKVMMQFICFLYNN